jgi:hypothetical protein
VSAFGWTGRFGLNLAGRNATSIASTSQAGTGQGPAPFGCPGGFQRGVYLGGSHHSAHRDVRAVFGLCVPKTSSTSSDQAIFANRGTGASPSSDAVVLKIDRFGQRFQRRDAEQRAVRVVLIVVSLVLAQDPPQMALIPDEGAVQELAAASPIQRSAIAFMRGVRTLHSTVRIPASAKTASNAAV